MQGLTSCSSTTSRVVTLQELVGWMTSRLKLRTRTSSTGQELQENVGVDTSTRAWEYIRVHRGKAGVSSDSEDWVHLWNKVDSFHWFDRFLNRRNCTYTYIHNNKLLVSPRVLPHTSASQVQ